MSNAKSKQAKPKTGLARCMELASDRKGLVFLAAVLSSLAAIASFIPYIAVYFMIRSIIGVFPNLDQLDIPAVLLLGDMFKGKDTVDNVIINWFQKGETIENFFAWLNEYGNQNNVYVPICIDAINEVDDNSYWNSNLPLIIAKAEAYSNIKITCLRIGETLF